MKYILASAALLAVASAKDIVVTVGEGGDRFSPDNVQAEVGDRVLFHFAAGTHDVAVSKFDEPCEDTDDGNAFYSGMIQPSSSNNVFAVEIKDTNPVWFYCSVSSHCQNGMVGAINAPSSGSRTLANYRRAAANAGRSEAPDDGAFGGRAISEAQISAGASTGTGGASATGTGTSAATDSPATGTSTDSAPASTSNAAGKMAASYFAAFGALVAAVL